MIAGVRMVEYSYKALKGKQKTFMAMTGLNSGEFNRLLPYFHEAYRDSLVVEGKNADEKRGKPGQLALAEDKLLFILYYLKTYPLQEVLAYSFGLTQSAANHWVHRLSPVLREALKQMGHHPARLPEELLARLETEAVQAVGIDGTERRIQRPLDPDVQEDWYSGKKSPYGEEQPDRRVG